jgi:adenylylsulfate kinase
MSDRSGAEHDHVTPEAHWRLLGQRPVTFWLTGLSGAGKSTIAYALERALIALGRPCFVLDGDAVRLGLCRDLGYSPAGRSENIRRVAEVSRLMNDAGLIVISAFISPLRSDRERAREIVGASRFLEVFMSTPIAVCEQRDAKGMYRRARAGQIPDFTGVSAPYEAPEGPAVALDTSVLSVADCVERLLQLVSGARV